ncbi:MAG: ABC transporter permease [Ruminococcaceae bacterium]|nr:ABC transporter permease [Oscillospiraceae bacterium]
MKSLIVFINKELCEQYRSGRMVILGIVFILLGIMNPAIAKLTPWLLEAMADSLAESGMIVTDVTVSAMDSWVQFYKNIPMGLIAFLLLESSIFTKEYASGTLILSLTKGLARYKVVVSKSVVLTILWTVCYGMCFGITYGYNAYFWDNATAQNLFFSVFCWWLFGVLTIALTVLFSTLLRSNSGVLLGVGGTILVCYLVGLLPQAAKIMPTRLLETTPLLHGASLPNTYMIAILSTAILGLLCFILSIPLFNKKQL